MKNLKLLLLLLMVPAFGCSPKPIYGLAIVNGYCVGKNGVLLTGAQLKACCICDGTSVPSSGSTGSSSAAATAGSGDTGGLTAGSGTSTSVQGSGIASQFSAKGKNFATDSLKCRAIEEPTANPDVPCPTGLNEITFNLNNSAADTYKAISSLSKNLSDLIGKGSTLASNAVTPSAATAGSGSSSQVDLSGLNSASIIGATGTQAGGYAAGVITSSGGAVTGPSSPISVSSPAAAGRGGGGSGGGSGGSSSGSGSSSAASAGGSVTTDMSSAPVAGGGHYSPDTGGQTYAGGGGVGGFALGLDGGSTTSGGGTISHGDKGSAEMDLKGAKAPVSDGTVLKINDPEDYFTRIDLGQNLFGVVQKRYHEINVIWTKAP